MRIGILSMQRVYNHGSFLQAYGLKKTLEELGVEVSFVDIKPGKRITISTVKSPIRNEKWYAHFWDKVYHILYNKYKEFLFKYKYQRLIEIDRPVKEKDCDKIVIGSDEVFNFYQNSSWGVTKQMFGDTVVPSFSYAGSFGNSSIQNIEDVGIKNELSHAMKKMSHISVRDNNSSECVKYLVNITPEIHLDPVLIYNYEKEEKNVKRKIKQKYIAVYCYDNGIKSEKDISIIQEFAKKHDLRLISLGFYQRWCDYNYICSPFELLKAIEDAEYVLTDTFHGTVISIKKNKQFVTVVRKHNANKLGDLLNRFSLNSQIITDFNSFEKILNNNIDYHKINGYIDQQTIFTKEYLRRCIFDD